MERARLGRGASRSTFIQKGNEIAAFSTAEVQNTVASRAALQRLEDIIVIIRGYDSVIREALLNADAVDQVV